MSSESDNEGGIGEEFHQHFWKYAIGGIIVIFIGMVAYKIINVMLNNPLTNAVNTLAGTAGLLLTDFTKGCCSQANCDISEQDSCNSSCGCGWDKNKSICGKTTNEGVGSGGPFSLKCPLFLTGIIGLSAYLLVQGVGGLYSIFKSRKGDSTIDARVQTTGEKRGDIIREWRTSVDVAYEKWKKERGDADISTAEAEYAASRAAQTKFNQDIVEPLKNTNKEAWDNAVQNAKEMYENSVARAKDNDVDTDKVNEEMDNAAGTDPVNPHGE